MRLSPPPPSSARLPRLRRAGRLGVWLGVLFVAGCCAFDKPVPVAQMQERILPLPDLSAVVPPSHPEAVADCVPVYIPDRTVEGPLTLELAVESAYRLNPGLQALAERVAQARSGKQIVFADFLPEVKNSYRDIHGIPGSVPFALPTIPTVVGNVAFGGTAPQFHVYEMQVQWTVLDFGRRLAHYGQAQVAADIARLQYERGRQTVAFNVTVAYFAVLQAQATRTVAEEAVRRAEANLRDVRNFEKRGTAVRNDVLRAEVQVAEMRLAQVSARTAEATAVAALNQAVGLHVSAPTQVAERKEEPAFDLSLAQSLQLAVDFREEFQVVLRAISSRAFGIDAAGAEFLPRVYVGGSGIHQEGPGLTRQDLFAGGLMVQMDLFEGGRRLARLDQAKSELREAVAQAKEVCDRISYEVVAAYLAIDDARQRIELARTAVTQAQENLRLVHNLARRGDATPTEIVDAELVLIRSEQNKNTALFDYQTALARLAYAVGTALPSRWCQTADTAAQSVDTQRSPERGDARE